MSSTPDATAAAASGGDAAVGGAAEGDISTVRIIHLSDTHGHNDKIPALPAADILLHTGDFSNDGTPEEFASFDAWLLKAAGHIPHRFVILGNHDWRHRGHKKGPSPAASLDPVAIRGLLKHGTILEHDAVEACGVKIFGSGWCPWHSGGNPGDRADKTAWKSALGAASPKSHRFDEIPAGLDVLMTHGAPANILCRLEQTDLQWGGSKVLKTEVIRAKPSVHCFGHIHEQRGYWRRDDHGEWVATVEYDCGGREKHWPTFMAPPASYPGQIISNAAMLNHAKMERRSAQISGTPRLIVGRRRGDNPWEFKVDGDP